MSLTKKRNDLTRKIKDWKKNLKPFKEYNFLTPEFKKRQEARYKKLLASVYETSKERGYWNKYLKIVKESFKNENTAQKFRLSHVYALGIPFQILFLYSKKDIGKTRQLAKLLLDIRAKDPKTHIAFIRNTKEETQGFKKTMNDSIHWPTWTDGEHVYWKDEMRGKKKKPNPCGFMAYCTGYGFIKWQGSEFNNVKFWMWDECNSTEGGLTFEVFMSLNVFLSSLIRDKKEVQGFMFGNLLEKNNVFLERLGVGSHTRLKIFDVHEDNDKRKPLLSKLLYLNTGDLFKGIEKQKGLATQFLEEDEQLSLLSNRPGLFAMKGQYEELDLKNYYPLFSFVFRKDVGIKGGNVKKVDFILYLYNIPQSVRHVCWIEPFKTSAIKPGFKYIVSWEKEVANNYQMVITQDKEDFTEYVEVLSELLKIGEIWFGWNNSQQIFEDMWPKWESKFLSTEETSI